jgi:hypothetical protein
MSNDQTIFVFHGRTEDIKRLAQEIIVHRELAQQIFSVNGRLVLFNDGGLIPISRDKLHDIVAKHYSMPRLVSRDSLFSVELTPLNISDRQQLLDLNDELVRCAARGEDRPKTVSAETKRHVVDRRRQGESFESLGLAYGLPLQTLRQIVADTAAA